MKYEEKLSKMIRCQTVSVEGKYDDTEFKKLRDTVKELFPIFHKRAELAIYGDDCWIYRLKGKDSSHRIMLMSHHDVAPVKGEWSHEPFGGEIENGKVWGRGTVDTKGPLFAEFQAFEELLADGFVPECDVYLGSSCNEEIGGDGIPLAVKDFTEKNMKFDLVLDEGGAVLDPPLPGISKKCALVAVHEKGRCSLDCTCSSGAAHAGLAGAKETPTVRLAKFIAEINDKPPFITRLYPSVRAMFEGLAPDMKFPFKTIFGNLWLFKGLLLKLMPKMSSQAAALVGTACSFNDLSHGTDDEGNSWCRAVASLKCVDDKDFETDMKSFREIAAKYGVEITEHDNTPAEYHKPSDMTKPGFFYVMDTVREVFPEYAAAPMLLPAGTDSRHFADICPCVMRFAPIVIDKQQFASVHSPNENIDVETLDTAVKFYKRILTNVGKML